MSTNLPTRTTPALTYEQADLITALIDAALDACAAHERVFAEPFEVYDGGAAEWHRRCEAAHEAALAARGAAIEAVRSLARRLP